MNSIERSLDLDDVKHNTRVVESSSGAPTSAARQDSILGSAGIAPLGSSGAVQASSTTTTTTTTRTGNSGGNSGVSTTKSTHVSSSSDKAGIKPHTSTHTTRSKSGAGSSHGPSTVTTKKTTSSRSANGGKPTADEPIWKKLALVGAIAAAGVAIVAGARRFKDKEDVHVEPETGFGKLKRKTKESAHDAKHTTSHAAGNIGDSVSDLGHKISHAAGDLKDQVVGAGESAEHKAEHKAEQVKKEAEKAKQDAKDRMQAVSKQNEEKARLDAIAEQKRMTYGQDSKGHPKKALDDTGDGFLNYKAWWPWAKKDL